MSHVINFGLRKVHVILHQSLQTAADIGPKWAKKYNEPSTP